MSCDREYVWNFCFISSEIQNTSRNTSFQQLVLACKIITSNLYLIPCYREAAVCYVQAELDKHYDCPRGTWGLSCNSKRSHVQRISEVAVTLGYPALLKENKKQKTKNQALENYYWGIVLLHFVMSWVKANLSWSLKHLLWHIAAV